MKLFGGVDSTTVLWCGVKYLELWSDQRRQVASSCTIFPFPMFHIVPPTPSFLSLPQYFLESPVSWWSRERGLTLRRPISRVAFWIIQRRATNCVYANLAKGFYVDFSRMHVLIRKKGCELTGMIKSISSLQFLSSLSTTLSQK